ncbi:PREDICTED: poly [ADP-ribose] polymerase 14-like [Nanorana parkeri]|uniref:poly [ADP-ribose] polymerase 14-like n=1 Tax=Nanorana parkeri TaxID=125878 RepID=UPI0008549FA6|nr:PREDICTED: poly [ADP-ribose] polymerase 14-like [Nanorana parkeri]
MQYGNKEACVGRPSTLEFSISPSSWADKKVKDIINKKEISQQYEVIWPEEGCPCPIFKLIFPPRMSSNRSIMTKVVPMYKIVQYKINHVVWEAIRETITSFMNNGVQVKTDLAAGKVYLVGKSKRVTEVNPTFRNLVEETTRRIEKKNQSLTEVVPMSPAQYQIMCMSGLEKQMMEQTIRISGLRYEVLTAKRELYNVQQQIKSKCFKGSPHLVQFLVLTSDEKLSCLLFAQHNINALLETDDNVVKLTAYSEEVLKEAEKQLKQGLTCVSIFVEEKGLLGSPEWRSLLSHMNTTLNAGKCTVLILKCPPGAQNDVVITGLTSNVQKCHQKVSDFLKNNSTIRVGVPVKSKVMMQFIEDRRKDIWGKMSKKVNVTKIGDRICSSGPRVHVQEAALLIKNFLSSLHCDTLLIDKPGAKTFCVMNEKVHVAAAKEEFNCAIHLQEATIKDFVPGDAKYQVTLPNGLIISVYKGDLCRHNVDVIVNAANEDLQHMGGLANAILKAAGHKLQDDCDRIIRKNGRVSPGDSVITDAGNLPCKQVIHTVGPRWSARLRSFCERLLRRAITTSLQLAAENNHRSIAIPAVSSGIFAFPLKLCIEHIVEAVRIYVENQQTTLRRIHLVDTSEETVRIFCEVTKDKFGNQTNIIPPKAPAIQHDIRVEDSKKIQVPVIGDNVLKTKEGMIIKLLQKNIEDCTVLLTSALANIVFFF